MICDPYRMFLIILSERTAGKKDIRPDFQQDAETAAFVGKLLESIEIRIKNL